MCLLSQTLLLNYSVYWKPLLLFIIAGTTLEKFFIPLKFKYHDSPLNSGHVDLMVGILFLQILPS